MAKKKSKLGERKKFTLPQRQKRDKPFRDIDTDGVSYSFLAEFLGCREQARLSYVEGYKSIAPSAALDFGSAMHLLLEHRHEKLTPKSIKVLLMNYLKERLASGRISSQQRDELNRLCGCAETIFPLYCKYWDSEDKLINPIMHEQEFKIPYQLPSGRSITLRGRIDSAYRDKSKRLFLQENKTKGRIDEDGIRLSLPKNVQTGMYCTAIHQLTGEIPRGVLYNVIRSPELRVSKTETLTDFLVRLQSDIRKRESWYFMRWKVAFHPGDLTRFQQHTLNPILESVLDWWDSIKSNPFDPWGSPHHWENPEALFSRYGSRSQYFDLLTRGLKTNLVLRKDGE